MAEADVQDPLISQMVSGRYRVLKRLGEGGMGYVYLAVHEAIEKKVALKVLKPEYSAKEDIVTRFQQEAISASRIRHPNVLEVFDFGRLENGCAFLAMEFLHGCDLADELIRLGVVETSRALRLMLQICRALAAAHHAGVVHRDMKPDNVFLMHTPDGEEIVKILDFGIAQLRNTKEEAESTQKPRRRLTKTGMIFGTPEYMAPEQAAGKKADLRVDIYACGIILFESLTGAVPFTGDSFMAVLAAHLNDPPPSMMVYRPDLDISQELHDVVARALEKDPNKRFQSMTEFAAAILATPEGSQLQAVGDVSATGVVMSRSSFPSPLPGHNTSAQFPGVGAASIDARRMGTGSSPEARSVARPEGSSTLEAATSNSQRHPTKKSGAGLIVAALLSIGAVAAAGVALVPKLMSSDADLVVDDNAEPQVSSAPVAATQPPPVVTAPVASSAPVIKPSPVSTTVKLEVQTTPPGAVVSRDGFQVCDKTPCSVEVDKGDAVTLDAVVGRAKGTAKVLANKDQTVSIALLAPRIKKPVKKKKDDRLCEAPGPGGLKIFRPCSEIGR